MRRTARWAALAAAALALCCAAGAAQAASAALQYCDRAATASAAQQDALLRLAALVRDELDASGARVALLARSGHDLTRFGQHYSHAGIGLRADAAAPWEVRQLYYACDERRGRLYDQGLAGFVLGADGAATTKRQRSNARRATTLSRCAWWTAPTAPMPMPGACATRTATSGWPNCSPSRGPAWPTAPTCASALSAGWPPRATCRRRSTSARTH
jgi:hypothetical protein